MKLLLTSAGLSNQTIVKDVHEPVCALDDQSAVVVRDGAIKIVSEGQWVKLN